MTAILFSLAVYYVTLWALDEVKGRNDYTFTTETNHD